MALPPLPPEVYFLEVEQVVELHDSILLPSENRGVLKPGELESAVMSPQLGFSGTFYNTSIFEMAAALIIGLACNHAFQDGNKRTAVVSATVFLRLNDYRLSMTNTQFKETVLDVVVGKFTKGKLATWLHKKSVSHRWCSDSTKVGRKSSTWSH